MIDEFMWLQVAQVRYENYLVAIFCRFNSLLLTLHPI
jgi:hypothetical protein